MVLPFGAMTVPSILLYALFWPWHSAASDVPGVETLGSVPNWGEKSARFVLSAPLRCAHFKLTYGCSYLIKRQSSVDFFVALYLRFASFDDRQANKPESFHWGIHMTPRDAPGGNTALFHAVNEVEGADQRLFKYEKRLIDPRTQGELLGRIRLNTQPSVLSIDDVDGMLSRIPEPSKIRNPKESCVSWALCALQRLQDGNVIDRFDTTSFTTKALDYGEAQIKRFFETSTYDQARKVQLEIANYDCLSRKRQVCALVSQVQESISAELSGKALRPGGEALEARPLQQEVRPTLEVEVPDRGKPGESGRAKLHEMSTSLREQEFLSLAKKYKLENNVSKLSLFKLRREFMRFPTKAMSATFGSGKMAIITLSLYIKSVHDVFTSHSTSLDRAAILTSVIPVVGCATEAAAAEERGQTDVLDHSLCVLADTLLMTPAWTVGVVLSLGRMMIKDIPNLFAEHLQRMRDNKWREALENARHYVGGKNFTHDAKINLDLEMAAVVYGASEALGNLTAIESVLPESLVSDRDRRSLADEIERRRHEIEIKTCVDMVRRMGNLMEDMPKALVESLSKESGKFNDAFIQNYRNSMSSVTLSDFLISPAASLGFVVPVGSKEEVVIRNVQHLRDHPIPADFLKPIEDQARLRLFHILKSQWGLNPCSETAECKSIWNINDPDRKSDCDFDAVVKQS